MLIRLTNSTLLNCAKYYKKQPRIISYTWTKKKRLLTVLTKAVIGSTKPTPNSKLCAVPCCMKETLKTSCSYTVLLKHKKTASNCLNCHQTLNLKIWLQQLKISTTRCKVLSGYLKSERFCKVMASRTINANFHTY